MERQSSYELVIAGLAVLASGCASVPPARGTAEIDGWIAARGGPVPAWPQGASADEKEAAQVAALIRDPLTVEGAVELAFLRNPDIRESYAELGLAQADVLEASRLANPTFGYVDLEPRNGGRSQITRSISLNFAELLLLSARARVAAGAFDSARERIASTLLQLQAQVEIAWFEYVGALQAAEMRTAAAQAAEASSEYAQRLRDAGNIPPRALALELAAASEAQIAAARSRAEAIRARATLAGLLGGSSREGWRVSTRLPAPLAVDDPPAELIDQALTARLDVSAARREIAALEGAARLTRRWRWLGEVEVGYERESETDGTRLRGPSLALGLPLFNQNQSGVLRSQAALEGARGRLSALELSIRNDVAFGLDRLAAAREIAESYRTALVPQREAVVLRTQEEVNFMLTGAFELLQAKREQFNAYQEYLDAVRDYWLARVELRRAAGGSLAGDDQKPAATIGIEDLLDGDDR
ncbi:MAG: TolC family protein [Gammaproteobacteria bacterium]